MTSQSKSQQEFRKSLARELKMWAESGVDFVPAGKTIEESGHLGVSQIEKAGAAVGEDAVHEALENLRLNEIGNCTRCPLHKGRTHIVFGVGNPMAKLMFVGEGPGADEDRQGEPFVGKAGQLLTRMIEAMGLKRSEVYIANIVKCRPPDNRNPEPVEIATCIPFLKQQIEMIKPRVLVCLGKVAAQALLQTEISITKLRGEFQAYGDIQLMPTYHPAFLLRNPAMKRPVWEDLKKVMKILAAP